MKRYLLKCVLGLFVLIGGCPPSNALQGLSLSVAAEGERGLNQAWQGSPKIKEKKPSFRKVYWVPVKASEENLFQEGRTNLRQKTEKQLPPTKGKK